MNKRFVRNLFGLLLAALIFLGGYWLGQSDFTLFKISKPETSVPGETEEAFNPFWETWQILKDEYYVQELDDDMLAEGALRGMLASLEDPNTIYLSPEQEKASRERFQGNLEGIGAEVVSENGLIKIVAPYEGSPAAEAGLMVGDIIREADGISLIDMDAAEAAAHVRGPAGTIVHLVIDRDGEIIEIDVTRGVIKIPSVYGELLEDNIAYVRLSRFGNNTGDELETILEELGENDLTGAILDLRRNPGGTLRTALNVTDQFLDQGTILIQQFGNGEETVFKSDNTTSIDDIPLVVLIDQGSASASEVLAGAIHDRERGLIIGETSYGKGTVQTWRELSNGGGVRITIAHWLTPEGNWIHQEGIEPDIKVSLPDPDDDEFSDTQLQAAIDYLLGNPIMENGEEVE